MATIRNRRLTKAMCMALILATLAPSVLAYPPDNAAVLYYRACLSYRVDREVEAALKEVARGGVEVGDGMKEFIRSNRFAVKFAVTAADVSNCDWGLDYSAGTAMIMPPLSTLRNLARLLLADARVAAAEGDYELALDRCLSVLKMSAHIGDDVAISYLVSLSTGMITNECIQEILSDMPVDLEILTWLKDRLADATGTILSTRTAVSGDARMVLVDVRTENAEEMLGWLPGSDAASDLEKLAAQRLREADDEFFDENRDYYKNYMSALAAVLDPSVPYAQAYDELTTLSDKIRKDALEGVGATLATFAAPEPRGIYNKEIEYKTFLNAVKTAVDIYIVRAKTGRLPDAPLPHSPRDSFSGKDFEYERQDGSFILRCRGKDLGKNKIHEYEFKVSR
ncbi:MAG: hypothetical protein JSU70_06870 [Phycisphaerales bacterium]|nr:MAG: hypothetical protein JSU70_06870 [Phycisphaerales bacterium]